MANLQFDLVSPERRLVSLEASEVRIPGADGDLTAMAGHASTIAMLRPGVLSVVHSGGTDDYIVIGGFVDISAEAVSVLAERALLKSEVTQEVFNQMMNDAKSKMTQAESDFKNEPGPVDDAAKLISDMVAIGGHIGLSAQE